LRSAAAAAAGAAVLAPVLAACSSSTGSSTDQSHFVSGSGGITVVKPADRKAAPDLSGRTIDGSQASLAAYRGKVVVINVWGSWCAPCRLETPNLVAVAKADRAKGVQFLGINTRDLETGPAVAFEKHFAVPYPSLYDRDGTLLLRFPKGSLNAQAIPSTLVIDRQGRIAARALKPLSEDDLNRMIDPVLAEQPAATTATATPKAVGE
jgi:thiol-disulfide isomerase/thioredoxin